MRHIVKQVVGMLAVAGLAPVLFGATAQADDGGKVYFSSGSMNCSIAGDGAVGCDFTNQVQVQYKFLPFLFPARDIVIDQAWLPAHPTFGVGAHTLPGGNPDLVNVKTGAGTWGAFIEHAGARCESGFHGSFSCTSKGRTWSIYGGIISAS
ncbi:hypothetical protein AB0L63_26385 [Nocardia sp. NPDC051990]|uniref:hypothetical protein n=1 Tax=Nocardia sp. NPDC051990 TaxID=3155285 RepID=UPI003444BB64